MKADEIHERVAQQFPGKISGFNGAAKDPYFQVGPEVIVDVCRYLRDEGDLKFDILSDLTALDFPKENKIQIVYHLYSYTPKNQIVLKVDPGTASGWLPALISGKFSSLWVGGAKKAAD